MLRRAVLAAALCACALLACAAAAAAASPGRVAVEAPVAEPLASDAEWEDAGPAHAAAPVRVAFAVRQRRGVARAECAAVSHPDSPRYGEHLSLDALTGRVALPRSAHAVRRFLLDGGVDAARVAVAPAFDFVRAELTAAEAARLLEADVRVRRHPSGAEVVHAASYSLPAGVAGHVDFVGGLTRLPNMRKRQPRFASARAAAGASTGDNPNVTPAFAKKYYDFPASLPEGASTAAVAEFPYTGAAEYYVESNLQAYTAANNLSMPQVTTRGGPNLPGQCPLATGDTCVESTLDIEVLAGFTGLPELAFWITPTNGTIEPFLEWTMALAAAADVESVHSVSFGDPERSFTPEYLYRIDDELAKLCSRGVTVLVASGDCGVQDDCKQSSCASPNADFPASSPHTVGVGATQILSGGEVVSSTATGSRITSGGMFSRVFPRPSYADAAASAYFARAPSLPTFPFNRTGSFSADVSMVGHNYPVSIAGRTQSVDGTSASTPAMAAVIAVVNAGRAAAGMPPVGLFTPALYTDSAVQAAFYDVTSGNNACGETVCCSSGFEAVQGWDPASGVGTPRVQKLMAALTGARYRR